MNMENRFPWKRWLVAGLGLIAVGMGVVLWVRSLSETQVELPEKAISQEALIAFQQEQVARQAAYIDSLVNQWGWTGAERSATGIVWRRVAGGGDGNTEVAEGTWIVWDVEGRLTDSTVFMRFEGDRPLRFRRLRDDVPRGFHAIAGWASPGDSMEAILPSHEAWGLTGWANKVPQDAIVVLRLRARSMTPELMPAAAAPKP